MSNTFEEENLSGYNFSQHSGRGSKQEEHSGRKASAIDAIRGLGSNTASSAVGYGNTADVLKTIEQLVDKLKNVPGATIPVVTSIETSGLRISAIAISLVAADKLYYAVLLLEAVGTPIEPLVQMVNGRPIPFFRVTADYWDNVTMKPTVESILLQKYRQISNVSSFEKLTQCAVIVVPKNIELTNQHEIAGFYDQSLSSIMARIKVDAGFPTYYNPHVNSDTALFKSLADKSLTLTASYDIIPGATFADNVTKQPIVADISCVLYAAEAGRGRQFQDSPHTTGGREVLASALVNIDFSFAPADQRSNALGAIPGITPVLVVTQLSTLGKSPISQDTLISALLGLGALVPLVSGQNQRWPQVFEPLVGDTKTKASIGNLGCVWKPINDNVPFEPKVLEVGPSSGYSATTLSAQRIASLYCTQYVAIALDVGVGSPTEWVLTLLQRATPGSIEEAIILKELDAATDNAFSQRWLALQQPMVLAESVTLYSGHYRSEAGPVDIRKIDFSTIANLYQNQPELIAKYAGAFIPNGDPVGSLQIQKELYDTIAPTWEATGKLNRVFLNPTLLECIDSTLTAVGMHITTEGLADNGLVHNRPHLNSMVLKPIATSNAFGAYATPATQYAYAERYMTNWGA